eukprot:8309283-Ditylum_brightwellii.AAC.1
MKQLLGPVREETITGDQITISLSKAQLISGRGHPFLQEVECNRSYVPANWLCNIRTFLECCKAHIKVLGAWHPEEKGDNDSILMDKFKSTHIEAWVMTGLKTAKALIPWLNQTKPPESY